MKQKLTALGFLLFVTLYFLSPAFSNEPEDGISSEGIQTIEETMKNLSGSLGRMPDAPRFEGQIQVPSWEIQTKKRSKE